MGCATSRVALQGTTPSKDTIQHRFWPLGPLRPSSCSKMEDMSINMKKREDDTMLIMERESSFSEQNLIGHDSDNHYSADQPKNEMTDQRISVSSSPLPKKINGPCSNELVLSRQTEMKEELKRETREEAKELVLHDPKKPREGDDVKRLTSISPSLSFKVYVIKLNGDEKIDGIEKEPKLEKIMENEEQSNLQQSQNKEESTSSSPSGMEGRTKLLKKTTIGDKIRRVVPKSNIIPIRLIFKAGGLYNTNKSKSLSKNETKLADVSN